MRRSTIILLLGALGAGAACATAGPERAGPAGATLEAEEIQAAGSHIRTAHDAVQHLRPQYLRTRASPTVHGRPADPIRVYVNGTLWGSVQALERIRAEEVVRIRYYRPSDAQQRFGMDHGSGAIEVVTVGR